MKILDKLLYQLHQRDDSGAKLTTIKEYINYIANHELGSINNADLSPIRKKIIKDSQLYERIAILMIGFIEIMGKFSEMKSYSLNLCSFAVENLLFRLSILTEGKDPTVAKILKERFK